MTVTIIAAIAANGVIGASNGIPWYVPGDQARSKSITMGHVLVMGRKTYDSIGRPLPGRTTIVVTRNPEWSVDGVHTVPSVKEALDLANTIDDEVFIFGGGEIYAQALESTDRMEITEVHAEHEGDVRFPDVDWSQWTEVGREHQDGFDWVTYERAT